MDPIFLIGAVVLVVCVGLYAWSVWFPASPSALPPYTPGNDLERSLLANVDVPGVAPELRELLRAATLLAVESSEAPGGPMSLTTTFPEELGKSFEGLTLNEEGKIQFGPWVVCFSSRDVVNRLATAPLIGLFLNRSGKVREFPAREVFQAALDQGMPVAVNPYCGDVSRIFREDELRRLLQSG